MKLILLIILLYVIYIVFFKKASIKKPKDETSQPKLGPDDMIKCAHCHTYATVDDMILSNGRYYCSPSCLKEAS